MDTHTNRNGLCRLGLILALAPLFAPRGPQQAGAIVSYGRAEAVILGAGQRQAWDMTSGPCQVVWEIEALEGSAGKIEFHKQLGMGSVGVKTEFFDYLQSGKEMKIGEHNVLKATVSVGVGKVKVSGECSDRP